jgi:Holliday junction resolvase RusA-like endonuclease
MQFIDLTQDDEEENLVVPYVPVVEGERRGIFGVINGVPQPQQQRRMSGSGNYYDPSQAKKAIAVGILRANRIAANDHSGPLVGALIVEVSFIFPAVHQHQIGLPHTGTPDIDNLQKFLFDAMAHAGFFANDSFIYKVKAMKTYSASLIDNVPMTRYSVKELQ